MVAAIPLNNTDTPAVEVGRLVPEMATVPPAVTTAGDMLLSVTGACTVVPVVVVVVVVGFVTGVGVAGCSFLHVAKASDNTNKAGNSFFMALKNIIAIYNHWLRWSIPQTG